MFRRRDFLLTVLVISVFILILSFGGYADCYMTSIVCNETNNNTWPCLSANDTFNYTYYFLDCSETMGISFPGGSPVSSGAQYAPGQSYVFSALVTVPLLDMVFFESNYTLNASEAGNLTNYTYPTVTNSSSVFTMVLTDLPAQKFVYRWLANDTGNNWSSTYVLDYTISKADNPVYLYFNGSLNQNRTYTYPEAVNATALTSTGTAFFYRNGTHLANGTTSLSEVARFGNGTYVYKVNATGNENYSDNSTGVTYSAIVNKGTLLMTITFSPASTVASPTQTTVTGVEENDNDGDVTYELRRDGALMVNSTETITLGVGTYNYTFNASGNENWTANTTGIWSLLTVQDAAAATFVPGGGSGVIPVATTVKRDEGEANISIESISSGRTSNITIVKTEDLAIRKVSLSVLNAVSDVEIRITKLQRLPTTVAYDISGKVYNYINIEKENITDADINRTILRFAVTKEWVADNSLNYSNISLYRWESSSWSELPTTYAFNDSFEYFYEAISPGFSVFVIGSSGSETVVTDEANCTEDWSCTEWSGCVDNLQTRVCTDSNSCGTETRKPLESQECQTIGAPIEGIENFPLFEVSVVLLLAVGLILFAILEFKGKIHLGHIRELVNKIRERKKVKYVYSKEEKND